VTQSTGQTPLVSGSFPTPPFYLKTI